MRNSRCKTISIVILTVLSVLLGCAQPEMENMKNLQDNKKSDVVAVIRLPNEEPSPRTIIPTTLGSADHYTITLTDSKNTENVYKFEEQTPDSKGLVEIKDVPAGSYKVHVDGYNTKTNENQLPVEKKIFTGDSKEELIIYKSEQVGKVTVYVEPISDDPSQTGNIQITFDWSRIGTGFDSLPAGAESKNATPPLQTAIEDGILKFQILVGRIGSPYEKIGEPIVWNKNAEGASPNSIKCLFTGIPTGEDITVKFNILNSADETVVEGKFNLTAWVYADQTSVWVHDENPDDDIPGSESLYLTNELNTWYSNIPELTVEYPIVDKNSSLIMKWKDSKHPDGKSIFKTIKVEIGKLNVEPGQEDIKTYVINTADLESNEFTFTGLTANQEYYIKTSTVSQGGKPSDTYTWLNEDGSGFKTKVDIKDITFSNGPDKTIVTGETFPMTATIVSSVNGLPVSYPLLTWSSVEDGMFSLTDISEDTLTATIKAEKPGITKIKVVNNDSKEPFNKETSFDVKVKFSTPADIYAAFTTEAADVNNGIQVTWTPVEHATAYDVYRQTGSGDFVLYKEVTENTFIDDAITCGTSYAYKVTAKNKNLNEKYSFDVTSELSRASETVTVATPTVSIVPIDLKDKKIDIVDNEGSNLIVSNGRVMISLKAGEKKTIALSKKTEGITTYSWYVNGTDHAPAVKGTWEEANRITLSAELPYIDLGENGIQELTLVANDGKKNYGTLIQFIVITKPVTDVTFNRDIFRKSLRYSTNTASEDLVFSASTTPAVPTMGALKYELVEGTPTDVIRITDDSRGSIEILKDGVVSMKVTSVENPALSDVIELTFYKPTIESNEALLNMVNKELQTHLEAADDKFQGDWFAPGPLQTLWRQWEYSAANVEVKSAGGGGGNTTEDGYPGYLKFTDYPITVSAPEPFTYKLNGTVHTESTNPGNYWGDDHLKYVGKSGKTNDIVVTLPYHQGTVTISYNQINVFDQNFSDPNSKPGSYTIKYSGELMNPSGTVLKNNTTINAKTVNKPAVNIIR